LERIRRITTSIDLNQKRLLMVIVPEDRPQNLTINSEYSGFYLFISILLLLYLVLSIALKCLKFYNIYKRRGFYDIELERLA